jgi:hypothetical protein
MPIEPKPKDIGRMVRLEPFNAPHEHGELVEISGPDGTRDKPFAWVKFSGYRQPIATYCEMLHWVGDGHK